jgi:hypothetical protein
VGLGAGIASVSQKADGAANADDTAWAVPFEVAIGGSPTPGLVVGAGSEGAAFPNATVSVAIPALLMGLTYQ